MRFFRPRILSKRWQLELHPDPTEPDYNTPPGLPAGSRGEPKERDRGKKANEKENEKGRRSGNLYQGLGDRRGRVVL